MPRFAKVCGLIYRKVTYQMLFSLAKYYGRRNE